jgi:hypothetical protein
MITVDDVRCVWYSLSGVAQGRGSLVADFHKGPFLKKLVARYQIRLTAKLYWMYQLARGHGKARFSLASWSLVIDISRNTYSSVVVYRKSP